MKKDPLQEPEKEREYTIALGPANNQWVLPLSADCRERHKDNLLHRGPGRDFDSVLRIARRLVLWWSIPNVNCLIPNLKIKLPSISSLWTVQAKDMSILGKRTLSSLCPSCPP